MSNNVILLIARILLSVIFIMAGLQKFTDIGGTAGYIASVGLPAPTLAAWLSAAFETLAGLAILTGFFTRYAAWLFVAFCIVTGVFFHFDPANQMQMISLMKNLAIAGGFMALSVTGPGSISIDARRGVASAVAA